MPIFVALGKLTTEGAAYMRDLSLRHKHAVANAERLGGKLVASYALMRQYDFMAIFDCPNEKIAMKILAKEASRGNVRYETMTDGPIEEFAKLVEDVGVH